jgi:hypothetical protein
MGLLNGAIGSRIIGGGFHNFKIILYNQMLKNDVGRGAAVMGWISGNLKFGILSSWKTIPV